MESASEEDFSPEGGPMVEYPTHLPMPRNHEISFFDDDSNYEKFIKKSKYLRFDLVNTDSPQEYHEPIRPQDQKIIDLVFQKIKLEIPPPDEHDLLTLTFKDHSKPLTISSSFAKFHSEVIRVMLSLSGSEEARLSKIHFDKVSRKDFKILFGFLYSPDKLAVHLI